MMRRNGAPAIRLYGVRHNNLKNFDLELPLGRLLVVTGLSGSGKSSLAFDTLFAEGQRRYIETFSPYARQFFDRMDKPRVDRIEGIPPAIAIEQRNTVKTTRSTVGTITELCDYFKLLWPHLAQLHCRQCGQPVRQESPQRIWSQVGEGVSSEVLITFQLPLSEKLALSETLALINKQGYQRLLINQAVVRLDEAQPLLEKQRPPALEVIQDRLKLDRAMRHRFVEACEQAYHFGKGKLMVHWVEGSPFGITRSQAFSRRLHCAACDIEYREPTPALFSFNNPVGACPACRGFGRVISIDYRLAIPDPTKTLAGGAVKPWQSGQSAECQTDLLRMCRHYEIPTDVPFEKLSQKWQRWLIDGDPDYGRDEEHEWPRAWYGIKGYFRWLESRAYKMHVRVMLSRYRSYSPCTTCNGQRFQPDSLLFRVSDQQGKPLTLADIYQMPVADALELVSHLAGRHPAKPRDPLSLVFAEVRNRLAFLVEVGLGYLTLDRPTRSLSGGETERVSLTTCLGTRLVNTLYVLDEPSVGLHPRDTTRLVQVLQRLRDLGNTVVVVEHEPAVMRAADQVIDLGPGHGETGGQVVFQGNFKELTESSDSLTGQYLSGRRVIEAPTYRPVDDATPQIAIAGATRHNLKNLTVKIPLGRFVCLTGVSGSGKTTLARDILLPLLENCFRRGGAGGQGSATDAGENGQDDAADADVPSSEDVSADISGWESLGRVVLVDQSPLGKTPRSNPIVYIGAFDDVRELFAQSETARQRGLNASAFSFNSAQGQCERCRGAGFEKIEMQFLSDVFIRCPDCDGRRYRAHLLEVKLRGTLPVQTHTREFVAPQRGQRPGRSPRPAKTAAPADIVEWSIADFLEATVDEAIQFLMGFVHLPAGRRALQSIKLLQEVGLGYLRLGQPINTLSGGESQRLKLVTHLAEFYRGQADQMRPALFLFDEPTTGLHFEDIRVLLQVFHRLVDAGHSLLVIEHNLEVIKCADWVVDLGPEAGAGGGKLVVAGPPERVAACSASHTGRYLAEVLPAAKGKAKPAISSV